MFIFRIINQKRNFVTVSVSILLLFAIFCGIVQIYRLELKNEEFSKNIGNLSEDILPIPDRIIYKNASNEYYIWNLENGDIFTKIYSKLYLEMQNTIQGIVYTEEGISGLQQRGSFIEFDYDTKSKNYVFFLEEDEVGAIKRFSDSGQVIKTTLKNKEEISKLLSSYSKNQEKFDFESKDYTSKNHLEDFYSIENITLKREGVFQTVLTNDNVDNSKLLEILEKINFEVEDFPKVNFEKQNVIITISRYDFNSIKVNIGNVKYEFGKGNNDYTVNVLITSKVTNVNCIYYNLFQEGNYTELNQYVNLTASGVILNIGEDEIKMGLGNYKEEYLIKINSDTKMINYETQQEITMSNIQQGDILYVEGEKSLEEDGIPQVNAKTIEVCSKEKVKSEVSLWLLDTYIVDGPGIEYTSVDNYGNGFIVVCGYYDKFKYPIKLNVNSKTETFLGMGRHLSSNYGYVLHEICDITLDTKITDIDNIKGYVTTIEYIAD